jgi:hypothetical protein
MPLLTSSLKLRHPMRPQAEEVQNWTSRIPKSFAALRPKLIIPSETMQVTGGTSNVELSLSTSSLNGARQFFLTESHRAGTSWVASRSDGGNPSGIVSNWKSGKPFMWSGPLDQTSRMWLNSVLTKVMRKPLECSSLANRIMGVTCPCGNGTHTAWGFLASTEPIFSKFQGLVMASFSFVLFYRNYASILAVRWALRSGCKN